MTALYRCMRQFGRILISPESNRNISVSAITRLREIIEKKEGNTLTIEGVKVPQKNEDRLLKVDSKACVLCATNLDVKHTDVLILSQFLRSDGCMLPRRVTGLCKIQQKRIGIMVAMAYRAGLMPRKRDPRLKPKWKKYNTYYDEETIMHKFWNDKD